MGSFKSTKSAVKEDGSFTMNKSTSEKGRDYFVRKLDIGTLYANPTKTGEFTFSLDKTPLEATKKEDKKGNTYYMFKVGEQAYGAWEKSSGKYGPFINVLKFADKNKEEAPQVDLSSSSSKPSKYNV